MLHLCIKSFFIRLLNGHCTFNDEHILHPFLNCWNDIVKKKEIEAQTLGSLKSRSLDNPVRSWGLTYCIVFAYIFLSTKEENNCWSMCIYWCVNLQILKGNFFKLFEQHHSKLGLLCFHGLLAENSILKPAMVAEQSKSSCFKFK